MLQTGTGTCTCLRSPPRPGLQARPGRGFHMQTHTHLSSALQHARRPVLCSAVQLSGAGAQPLNRNATSSKQTRRQQQGPSSLVSPSSSSSLLAGTHRLRFSTMRRRAVLPPLAMVNVDFASPSLVLGVTLIGCGVALLQVRNMQREVSRDADIVVAAMISIVGSTLIFQGWRLDPLLLLCQALTTSVAFWYGLEAFKLRAEVVQEDADMQQQQQQGQQMPPLQDFPGMQQPDYMSASRPGYLPPGSNRPAPPWAQQQQQQQQAGGYGPGSSARWGSLPAAGQQQQGVPYDSFAGSSSSGVGMPEATYAGGYDPQEAGSSGGGQQQYIPGGAGGAGGMYGGGYGNGMYDAAGYGAAVQPSGAAGQQQQQQQAEQYQWPPGSSYGQPPFMQQQQQPAWFDAAGMPVGPDGLPLPPQQQQQLPYGGYVPGLADPYMGPGAVPGQGQYLPSGYGPDGSSSGNVGLPLPAPADAAQQQQQQQGRAQAQQRRPPGSGGNAYEQVDDWE